MANVLLVSRKTLELAKGVLELFDMDLSIALRHVTSDEEKASVQAGLDEIRNVIEALDESLARICPLGVEDGEAHADNVLCQDCDQQEECSIFIPF